MELGRRFENDITTGCIALDCKEIYQLTNMAMHVKLDGADGS